MASFKPREVVSILQKVGFVQRRQTGSHIVMFHSGLKRIISVPMHRKDMKRGLLQDIIKKSDSTEKEFLKLK